MRRLVACLVLAATPILVRGGESSRKPNLIVIMADDFGYECVTANGGESYQTPHLDKLAATGVRFEQCHVQPLCTPTRVQLMTGKWNVRNYVRFGLLPKGQTTFAHLLKKAGYVTGIIGKWQLGREVGLPRHFGFDEAYLWQHTRRPPRYANPGLEHDGKEIDFKQGEYGPKLVNDFALDFVGRHRKKPFLLYYSMILTHDPFQPTPDSKNWDPKAMGEKVHRDVKHFADMTAYMDKMIGRLVSKLDELGLRENTLIVFLGDNGTHPSVVSMFRGRPYRGGKGTTTARGTHVPLIVNWPGRIKGSRVNRDLTASVDVFPTLCQAAGIAAPAGLDGVGFLPQLVGERGAPREWLYCWYSPRQKADLTVKECAFDHDYKLYRGGKFFDLRADPFEERPLEAGKQQGRAAAAAMRLQGVLDGFREARPARLDGEFEKGKKKGKV